MTRSQTWRSRGVSRAQTLLHLAPGNALPLLRGRGVKRASNRGEQLGFADWFDQEIDCAFAHRARGRRHVAVGAQEDHRHRDALPMHRVLDIEAAHVRHAQVEEHAADAFVRRRRKKVRRRPERGDLVARCAQHPLESHEHGRLIIDNEDTTATHQGLMQQSSAVQARSPVIFLAAGGRAAPTPFNQRER